MAGSSSGVVLLNVMKQYIFTPAERWVAVFASSWGSAGEGQESVEADECLPCPSPDGWLFDPWLFIPGAGRLVCVPNHRLKGCAYMCSSLLPLDAALGTAGTSSLAAGTACPAQCLLPYGPVSWPEFTMG